MSVLSLDPKWVSNSYVAGVTEGQLRSISRDVTLLERSLGSRDLLPGDRVEVCKVFRWMQTYEAVLVWRLDPGELRARRDIIPELFVIGRTELTTNTELIWDPFIDGIRERQDGIEITDEVSA